jgi:transposase
MEMFVAVSPDRDAEPIRRFGSFTADLKALTGWLEECGVTSVAMESTGVYWIPLYQMLADAGMEVCLVNARHFQNVPGRKTDVMDCQWLQYLHSVGLLRGSFRPEQVICATRTLLRHRQNLVQMAAEHVLHMQKSMEQMNLKLQHVISDITGVTGLRIVDAIVAGERDPRATRWAIGQRGDHHQVIEGRLPEGAFGDAEAIAGIWFYQKQIADLDGKMEGFMDGLPAKIDLREHPLRRTERSRRYHNAPAYNLRQYCYRAFGVDVTAIPGIAGTTAQVLLTEVGPDLSKFGSASAFASWLTLCPHNDISGGKVLRAKTRRGSNRAALALRLGAQTLEHTETQLGHFFRRMRGKLGRPQAITAVAHKIARIFYTLVATGKEYDESALIKADTRQRERQEAKLRRQARELGFQLVAV